MATKVDAMPDLSRLTRAYIRIRDAKAELKAAFDAKDASLTEQQDLIKQVLLAHCKDHGVESVRTDSGMFYRTTKTRYSTRDWEAMHKFILEHGLPELLEKRLNQTEVRELLAERPDLVPPALDVSAEYTISVRKA